MGADAQADHPQQVLWQLQRVQLRDADLLREEVPKNWVDYRDQVADNFRVISPTEFRIIA
jgi:hypothetical protein